MLRWDSVRSHSDKLCVCPDITPICPLSDSADGSIFQKSGSRKRAFIEGRLPSHLLESRIWIVSELPFTSTIMPSACIGRVCCCWILRSNRPLPFPLYRTLFLTPEVEEPHVSDAEIRIGSEAIRASKTLIATLQPSLLSVAIRQWAMA